MAGGMAGEAAVKERGPALPPRLLVYSNVGAWLLLLLVNGLSGLGVFGDDNGTISARHPTPITPSGWAFSIWGIIFLLQGAGVIYAALPADNAVPWKRQAINTIGYRWQVGWAFQCAWQLLFVFETALAFWLCLVCLAGAFAAFAWALWLLHSLAASTPGRVHPLAYAFFFVPTAINAAWLSVATGLGALVLAGALGISTRADTVLAILLLLAACLLGLFVLVTQRDGFYGLTLVWALSAIAGRHSHLAPPVYITCLVCLSLLGLATILAFTRRRERGWPADGVHDELLAGQSSVDSQLSRELSRHASAGEAAPAGHAR